MRPFLLAALFAAAARADTLDATEASLHLGGHAAMQALETGRSGVLVPLASAEGRYLWRHLALDGLLVVDLPTGDGPRRGFTFAPRAGVALEHVTAVVGPSLRFTADAPAVQLLPSLTIRAGTTRWRGVLGVADRPEVLARIGVEYERFSLAWAAALGLEGTARFPLSGPWQLDVRAWAFDLLGGESIGATAGLAWVPGGAP